MTALDLTPAVLRRAMARASRCKRSLFPVLGDATALPFATGSFDAVVLHLILAVVPAPHLALAEAARVLRAGGRLLVLDKFLKPGERAPLLRLANLILAPLLTRTDVVFEKLLPSAPGLRVTEDRLLVLA